MTSSGRVYTLLSTDGSRRKVSCMFSMDLSVEMHGLVMFLPFLSHLFMADILYVVVRCSCVVDPYTVLCVGG